MSVTRTPRIARADEPGLKERLESIWETKPGLWGWLGTVDHKEIGKRYLVTAFVMLLIGGLEAALMRLQLAGPDRNLLTPEQYNALYSTHGMTMIFLYASPILSGFSNFFFPLWLGARDMAFPRMNALSYWIYLAAALFLYAGPLTGHAPNDGWFNYAPYSERAYNPGLNQDIYALGMVFLGISTTVGAANFLVTMARCRAPGMSINRLPIMVWGTITANAANLVVVPSVSLAFFLLWMDRNYGTSFFDTRGGGHPLLWQHLFWLFGHPWVYAIVLPAMGIVSDGLPIFSRTPLVGYSLVALATVATMLLGFGVWVHHMFATGLPGLGLAFFSGASILIAIPSAVSVFAWIATIWNGRPVFACAFLYFASMIVLFVIGGVSGFMTASVPVDWQLTDTYFVVAHIHYVLIGINVFPVLGALHMYFPKIWGRYMNELWGKRAFWIIFTGFNVAFLPMHLTGLLGMPRRVYTYAPGMGFSALNLISTLGAFVMALGVLVFVVNALHSWRHGRIAPADPWGGPTLEWAVESPPPSYNFAVIPTIVSRHPLWEDQLDESDERSTLDEGMVLDHGKEALGVSLLDAEPQVILKMPEDTTAPFWLTVSCAVLFTGLLFHAWWAVILGGLGATGALVAWTWPRRKLLERASEEEAHA